MRIIRDSLRDIINGEFLMGKNKKKKKGKGNKMGRYLNDDFEAANVASGTGPPKNTPNNGQKSYSKTGGSMHGSYWSGTGSQGASDWCKFKHEGTSAMAYVELDDKTKVHLHGAAKPDLDFGAFAQPHLLLNLTGSSVGTKNIILKTPQGWSLDEHALTIDEILLDWPDRGVPALRASFWKAIWQGVIDKKITRIIACCLGGHGRTGTTLAALLVARGFTAKQAIAFVRKTHCTKAIETESQEDYLAYIDRELNGDRSEDKVQETEEVTEGAS